MKNLLPLLLLAGASALLWELGSTAFGPEPTRTPIKDLDPKRKAARKAFMSKYPQLTGLGFDVFAFTPFMRSSALTSLNGETFKGMMMDARYKFTATEEHKGILVLCNLKESDIEALLTDIQTYASRYIPSRQGAQHVRHFKIDQEGNLEFTWSRLGDFV